VVNHHYDNGQLEYRIKWKNYNGYSNSWEPASVIEEAADKAVADYKQTKKGKTIDNAKNSKRKRSDENNSDDT
jgi:hypothetical protein